MKAFFRAEDGTVFDTPDECMAYEKEQISHTFKMWDKDLNPITTYTKTNYLACAYVYLANEEELEDFKGVMINAGCSCNGLNKPGFYFDPFAILAWPWSPNGYDEDWEPLEKLIEFQQKELDNLRDIKQTCDEIAAINAINAINAQAETNPDPRLK